MITRLLLAAALLAPAAACGPKYPPVPLTEQWPAEPGAYEDVTRAWTRKAAMRGEYQEALELVATFKSPEWRAAHAARDAEHRMLSGAAREAVFAQAKADAAGPYEVELLVTTWERRENDLDRGERSVWRVVLIDEQGNEIKPLEIVKDKRPASTVRADFPALGDFATPYIARFPRTTPVLGPSVRKLQLGISGVRGGLRVEWNAE